MAIKALAWMVNVFEPPVYCYHEIVHNQKIVDLFSQRGVIFVNDIAEVPTGSPIMLSAHGSAPQVVLDAQNLGSVVVDAVCPLVTKVHHELKVRANKGYTVLYVGHDGHDEAVGTMAVAPESVRLLQHDEDVKNLNEIDGPVALLAQTTLAHSEWESIRNNAREKFPELWMPGRNDLCFATTNRQAAVRELASKVDAFVVIGSENSSNTRALERTAREFGTPLVVRINDISELPELYGVVAITAGASAPEELVQSVITYLQPEAVEEFRVTEEDEYFPIPREMRDLSRALALFVTTAFGGSISDTTINDREISATRSLSELAHSA